MGLSMPLGLDRLLTRTIDPSVSEQLGIDFVRWLGDVRRRLDQPNLQAALFWPKQKDRGRVYAHLFSDELSPIGFVKISLDDENDRWLGTEADALRELERIGFKSCALLPVLGDGWFDGHRYLIFEPLPATARPLSTWAESVPPAFFSDLRHGARHVPGGDVPALSWWQDYTTRLSPAAAAFDEELRRRLLDGLEVCRAHGDPAPANLFREGRILWAVDWEESRPDAPLRTDELSFTMATNGIANAADIKTCVQRFRRLMGSESSDSFRTQLMSVLAYRFAMGHRDAISIVEHWGASQ
jgi:hypothetical protein